MTVSERRRRQTEGHGAAGPGGHGPRQRARPAAPQLHQPREPHRAAPQARPQRQRAHLALQDRALPALRGERQLQVRRQVPVRPRLQRAAQPRAPPQVQDRALPHLPQDRLLPIRAALPLRAQLRGGAHPQHQGEHPAGARPARGHRRAGPAAAARPAPAQRQRQPARAAGRLAAGGRGRRGRLRAPRARQLAHPGRGPPAAAAPAAPAAAALLGAAAAAAAAQQQPGPAPPPPAEQLDRHWPEQTQAAEPLAHLLAGQRGRLDLAELEPQPVADQLHGELLQRRGGPGPERHHGLQLRPGLRPALEHAAEPEPAGGARLPEDALAALAERRVAAAGLQPHQQHPRRPRAPQDLSAGGREREKARVEGPSLSPGPPPPGPGLIPRPAERLFLFTIGAASKLMMMMMMMTVIDDTDCLPIKYARAWMLVRKCVRESEGGCRCVCTQAGGKARDRERESLKSFSFLSDPKSKPVSNDRSRARAQTLWLQALLYFLQYIYEKINGF